MPSAELRGEGGSGKAVSPLFSSDFDLLVGVNLKNFTLPAAYSWGAQLSGVEKKTDVSRLSENGSQRSR
ncbi:MAG: hypothetical protein ACOVNV_07815, partial [Pirellulaceae bacterium]